MIGIVVKVAVGTLLFAGTLVGGLAATGRLNHEGTANIPVLNMLFPAPPEPAEGEATDGAATADGQDASADGHAAPADAHAPTEDGHAGPADAAHGEQDPVAAGEPRKQKVGRSLNEPEPKAGGHGGDAHGAPAADPHGKPADAHGKPATDDHGKPAATANGKDKGGKVTPPERDFGMLAASLDAAKAQYSPGNLYRFDGLPAGVTPEQINDAWQRVQAQLADLDRRKVVLDQQEQQLRELGEDISRRQVSLGKERVEVEQMQRQLDAKIQKFQETVTLVRADEVAALKRNAQTLTAFEPSKSAELIEAQWKTEKGQDEALKLMEFMDKDALNEILAALPGPTTADILKKRLRVAKEPAAPPK